MGVYQSSPHVPRIPATASPSRDLMCPHRNEQGPVLVSLTQNTGDHDNTKQNVENIITLGTAKNSKMSQNYR